MQKRTTKAGTDLRFPIRVMVYTDEEGERTLRRLAEKWEISQTAAARRAIREAAEREGLAERTTRREP